MGDKGKKIKYYFFVFFVLIFILFSFEKEKIQNVFFLISSPLHSFFGEKAKTLSSLFEALFDKERIVKENEKLKKENEKLATENFRLKEKEKENEFLRKALNLSLEKDYQLALVKVVSKNFLEDTIIINQGRKHGLTEGMILITAERALVGKIVKALEDFSIVQLTSDKNFLLDVQLNNSEIFGIGRGEGNLKIKVSFLPPQAEIKEDDYFFTSSLSQKFPQGLIFGKVKKIENIEALGEKNVWLELPYKLSTLSFLFVITSW
jgi:rod shape-determining protein MreC